MKNDEYPLLINDPSDFMMRYLMPRMFGNLKAMENLPKFATAYFAFPEIRRLLKTLKKQENWLQ